MISPLKINHHATTKHFRPRVEPIKYIIIHCSAPTPEEQLKTLNELGLSTHYILSATGHLTELLSPEKVAYHAGLSHWFDSAGESLNNTSIGIEIENQSLGQEKGSYTAPCLKKLYHLIRYLSTKYQIKPENILGHSDIAPTRKPDPGVAFPWKRLAKHGFGLWYNERRLMSETNETTLLETIGYDTKNLPAARYAFCRHFFSKEVFVDSDIKTLLDTPYPLNFTPKDQKKYLKILRATAHAFKSQRKNA